MQTFKTLTLRPLYERTSLHQSVTDEVVDPILRDSYEFCRSVTQKHAKTFYLSTRFLPYEKQRAIFAIYALCRYIDDTIDEAYDLVLKKEIDKSELKNKIDYIRHQVRSTFAIMRGNNKLFKAVADTIKHYPISQRDIFNLIDGVELDLFKDRFANFEELYDYSYKVASTVGLMTSEVFGYSDKEALNRAVDLGIAMQSTNIIRDVGEDLDRDRIYLPADEMRVFGVSEENLFAKKADKNFKALIKYQVDRARRYYESAEKGIWLLNRDSRLPVWLARKNYARILDKVEKMDYDILNTRVYLKTVEKLSILPSSVVKSYLL